jgi:multiple antibiotic resistance protein
MPAEPIAFFISAVTTLFVVIDPIGVAPVFAALTKGQKRTAIAIRACIIAAIILVGFTLVGSSVLEAVGISMPAFRVAGGLLLFLIGLEMVFERRQARKSKAAERSVEGAEGSQGGSHSDSDHDDVAVFPLAMPLLAGPGAITSVVLLSAGEGLMAKGLTLGALFLVLIASVILLALGGKLLDLAGRTVTMATSRLMGVIVCALSVQYVLDGTRQALGL